MLEGKIKKETESGKECEFQKAVSEQRFLIEGQEKEVSQEGPGTMRLAQPRQQHLTAFCFPVESCNF